MTVAASTSRADYNGNGATTAFTVPFYFLANSHLQVIKTSSAGVATTLVLNSDYTVSGAGSLSGGTVTCTTAPATGTRLSILRDVPLDQQTHYVENDPFPAASHEQAIDKLTMIAQQHEEEIGRSMTLPPNVTGASTELPYPEAGKIVAWNSTATELENIDVQTLATVVSYGTAARDFFSGDGVTTTFVLTSNPGALANLDVDINGVTQKGGVDFLWSSGTTLTFTSAPPSGTNNIQVRYMQALAQGTADAAAVTYQPSGIGAQATDVQTVLRETVSAKRFGAVGNGVNDDTTAIQTALNSGAKRVRLGDGGFLITSSITIPNYVTLEGDGYANSPGVAATRLIKSGNFTGVVVNAASQLLNLNVEGDVGNGGDGVQILGGRSNVRNVASLAHGRDGFKIGCYSTDGASNTNLWRCENLIARSNGRYGCFVSHERAEAANVNGGSVVGIDVSLNGSHGINSENAFGNTFVNPTCQTNTGYAMRFAGDRNSVYGIYSEANTVGFLLFEATAQYNTVHVSITSNDGAAAVNDLGGKNSVWGNVDVANSIAYQKQLYLSDKLTIDNSVISGIWEVTKDGTSRNLNVLLNGTNGTADVFIHPAGTGQAGVRFSTASGSAALRGIITNGGGTLNFGTIAANSTVDVTVVITGADNTYAYNVTPRFAVPAGIMWAVYWDGTASALKVRCSNGTAAGIAVSGNFLVTGQKIS